MAEENDAEDRTEAATARRLEQAREQGNVPLSRDLASFAGLAAASLVLMMAGPEMAEGLARRLQTLLARPLDFSALGALHQAARAWLGLVVPVALAALLAGAAAMLLQSGFLLNLSALAPDFSRLDPRRGFGRLVGRDHLVECGKSLLKAVVLGIGIWRVLRAELPDLPRSMDLPAAALPGAIMRPVARLLLLLLAAQAVIAVADMLWVRLRHAQRLRMSREEVKQDRKETDGDPYIKARLRQIRLARMRRRTLAAVPKATLVVTNPTHYAVALAYDRGQAGAPRVVAKGVDEVAARIREVAAAHRVPVVPNPPLARALYTVELDAEIPAEHFQAVAELIAYVWRLQRRGGR